MTSNDGKEIEINRAFEYPQNQYWVIVTKSHLQVGNYVVQLKFEGTLTNGIVGFYRSYFVDANMGKTRLRRYETAGFLRFRLRFQFGPKIVPTRKLDPKIVGPL